MPWKYKLKKSVDKNMDESDDFLTTAADTEGKCRREIIGSYGVLVLV